MTTSQILEVSRVRVLAVLPVTRAESADTVAFFFAERFKPPSLERPVEEVAIEILPAVERALRRLRADGKAAGPPWRRA